MLNKLNQRGPKDSTFDKDSAMKAVTATLSKLIQAREEVTSMRIQMAESYDVEK